MIVAVEDLRNVEFTLIMVDNKTTHTKSNEQQTSKRNQQKVNNLPILEYHTFPLPRVTGSRSSLKVMIPVPDYVFTEMPIEKIKSLSFSVTPVLFNIGINEHATMAGKFGNNGPQVDYISKI